MKTLYFLVITIFGYWTLSWAATFTLHADKTEKAVVTGGELIGIEDDDALYVVRYITPSGLKTYLESFFALKGSANTFTAEQTFSGNIVVASISTSAADGSRRSELPNNTTISPLGGGVEEIYNEGGAIKAVENDTEYDILLSRDIGEVVQSPIATEITAASSAALTAAQVSGTMITNYGQGASDVALTLPTAAAGYHALFNVSTAQSNKWGVQAGASDKIYLVAAAGTVTAGSDNGYARMTAAQVGQSFACWTFLTGSSTWDWQCKAVSIGTSTFAAN